MVTPSNVLPGHDGRPRCPWSLASASLTAYHDDEWGRVLRGDRALFERMSLEAFQAGLSWRIVLERRDRLRGAFAGFDPSALVQFDDSDIDRLLRDPTIIRNRAKITAVLGNARVLAALHAVHGPNALDALIWAQHQTGRARPRRVEDVPSRSEASTALAGELRRLGFRFVGPTTVYSLMQAIGVVDDHLAECSVERATGEPTAVNPDVAR